MGFAVIGLAILAGAFILSQRNGSATSDPRSKLPVETPQTQQPPAQKCDPGVAIQGAIGDAVAGFTDENSTGAGKAIAGLSAIVGAYANPCVREDIDRVF